MLEMGIIRIIGVGIMDPTGGSFEPSCAAQVLKSPQPSRAASKLRKVLHLRSYKAGTPTGVLSGTTQLKLPRKRRYETPF